jgi:hypothetical protein
MIVADGAAVAAADGVSVGSISVEEGVWVATGVDVAAAVGLGVDCSCAVASAPSPPPSQNASTPATTSSGTMTARRMIK